MNPAIGVVARHELRLRWRALVAIGVVGGVIGGALLGGAIVARRTASAPDRLVEAVAPGDLRVDLYGSTPPEELTDLDDVERSTTATIAVGRLGGEGFVYLGMVVPEPDAQLLHPVVVAGRAPDPGSDDEVVVLEDVAEVLGLAPGDALVLDLLTADEVGQFDVGFGEPDGPRLALEVVGVVRTPPDVLGGAPIVAAAGVGRRLGDGGAGQIVVVELSDGPGARDRFEAAAASIGAASDPVVGREELPPVVVTDTGAGTRAGRATTRVLVVGMAVALVVGSVAAAAVLWQAFARHHGLFASVQAVEKALGLTAHERALARAVPAAVAAVVAILVALPLGFGAGGADPPGAAARLEPEPGWRADPGAALVGALLLGALIVITAYLTAQRAGRTQATAPPVRNVTPTWSPRRRGWPLLGTNFALSSATRTGAVPARASLVGAALGVAGIVATLTVGASLDRLVDTPGRWGWTADVAVVDATDDVFAALATDPRVDGLADVRSSSVAIGDDQVEAYAIDQVVGTVGWTVLEGRHPVGDDEVLVGTRSAEAWEVGVGDEVAAIGPEGTVRLHVVGVGIGPSLSGERLGESVAVTTDTLADLSPVQLFREALVDVAGADTTLVDELAARYEIARPEAPRTIRDLGELDDLPLLLGGFLAVLGATALLHGLLVTSRRRRRDLAVLGALGGGRREVGLTVLAMAAVAALAGVAVGLPLGLATGRLVWGEMAAGAGVAGDLAVPPSLIAVGLAVPVVALALAVWPAVAAARLGTAAALRQE